MGKSKTVVMLLPYMGNILPRMLTGVQQVAKARGWDFFPVICHRDVQGRITLERSPGGGTLEELFSLLRPAGVLVALGVAKPAELRGALGAAGLPRSLPVVNLDEPTAATNGVFAHGHAKSFAEMALRELLLSGFGDFAYAPFERDLPWGRARGEAFEHLIALAGKTFHGFPSASRENGEPPREKRPGERQDASTSLTERFIPWIASLPKPCGIFAANDIAGEAVLHACKRLGVDVPGEVAVVGVDDLAVICDYTQPTLSSVKRNLEGEGRAAAELLSTWLSHPGHRPKSVAVPAISLVRRFSTRFSWVRDRRVAHAEEWIRLHACEEGVGPRDVIKVMGVSRTLADRLFRTVAKRTILDEIRSTRIERAKEKIRGGVPYDLAAAECGFSSTMDFRRTFRQLVGVPIVKWMKGEFGMGSRN